MRNRKEENKRYQVKNKSKIKVMRHKYYVYDRTKILEYQKRYRDKRRMEIIDYYSGGEKRCACCGETELRFLTLDHIDGGGRKHRREIGMERIYMWIVKNKFPPNFQILCYNCNCARGIVGECPHKTKLSTNNDLSNPLFTSL